MKPKLRVLSNDELDAIYTTSLHLLKAVGVSMADDEITKVLKENGCDIGPHKVVYFPEALVKECLESTPEEITLCGRDPKYDMTIGRQKYPYVLPYVVSNYHDYASGFAPSTKKNMREYVTLCDYLESVDGVWLTTYVPSFGDMYFYHNWEIGVRNTTKPVFVYNIENPRSIDPAYELAAEIAGGKDELKRRPLLNVGICNSSPLIWNKYACAMLKSVARRGIVPVVTPEAPMGDSGPVTIAGDIALKIAEFLSGLVILQLLNRGMPVLMATPSEVFDQRTAAVTLASHGSFVSACAMGQIEEYLGVPVMSPASPDSHALDMQESYELAFTLLPLMLGGCSSVVFHGLATLAMNNELLLLLDDMVIAARRLLDGIEVNPETLAAEVIRDVCNQYKGDVRCGHFLDQRHTFDWYEKEHRPRRDPVIEKHRRPEWVELGSKDFLQRAHESVEEILRTHRPRPLSAEVEARIAQIRTKYKLGPDQSSI